jgi:hypothetical protein
MIALELHQRSIQELIKTAKALNSKLAQSEGKSAELTITLGLTLKEAKERKPEGITWPDFVKEHFDFGRSRADELIQIADGRTTVEKVRERVSTTMKQSRASPPTRVGGSPQDTADVPTEDQAHQIADAGSPADAKASKLVVMRAKADRAEATSAAARPKPTAEPAPTPRN